MDQFVAAWKDAVLKNYANFNGRLGVGGYWRFVGAYYAIAIVLAILAQVSSIFLILLWLWALALIVPGLAAGVRRLHDTGKPGIYVLVSFIPCVGLILLIVWTVQAGTPGDNQYGPPPVS
jgi:uncharacterized membrane protein YhaH (DUF805 family)